jgi:hypothetical protein
MSFFDDDEPTRVSSGPRRPAEPRRPEARPATAGGGPPDQQTARTRQLVAVGVALVILLVLGLAIKGCRDSRKERALKDYNRDVATIISASNEEVSKPFFELLSSGDVSNSDLAVQVNQLRLNAEEGVKRARDLDVPGEMQDAHQNVMLTLNLRAGGLEKIAQKLDRAQGRGQQAEQATEQIAGQMQAFLASDVIWSQRAAPLIVDALDDAGIGGQTVEKSQFLPGYTWLAPQTVAAAIGGQASGANGAVAPGLHGHGIISTKIGNAALEPSPASTTVPAKAPANVTVTFQNQGDNVERDVEVQVRLTAPGTKAVTAKKTVNTTQPGEQSDVTIPLTTVPSAGTAAELTVRVGGVPGEKNLDNNRQTYTVLFGS